MILTDGVYFFYFHDISNSVYIPQSIRTSPKRFESELNYITQHFSVIPLQEGLAHIRKKIKDNRPYEKRYAVINFDDGFKSIVSNALPLLKKHKTPFSIFVNSEFALQKSVSEALIIDYLMKQKTPDELSEVVPGFKKEMNFRQFVKSHSSTKQFQVLNDLVGTELLDKYPYLSMDEIRDLPGELVTIGNHTAKHLFLSKLSRKDQKKEIKECEAVLQSLPQFVPITAIPYGSKDSFNKDTQSLMAECNDNFLITAIGGINHTMSERQIEIERIGLSDKKRNIKIHVRNRTKKLNIFELMANKVHQKLFGTSN